MSNNQQNNPDSSLENYVEPEEAIEDNQDIATQDAEQEAINSKEAINPKIDDTNEKPETFELKSDTHAKPLTEEQLKCILEATLLSVAKPMTIDQLMRLFEGGNIPSKQKVKTALESLQADCEDRGVELKEVASGYRYQSKQEYAEWIGRLWEEKPAKYSRAYLETLALIAYRQPVTRGEIEEVRGVSVSSYIIKTMLEREWIRVVGHRDVPGRPSLYATTKQFLDYFNMKSLDELPSLAEIKDLDDLNPELALGEPGSELESDEIDDSKVETIEKEITSDYVKTSLSDDNASSDDNESNGDNESSDEFNSQIENGIKKTSQEVVESNIESMLITSEEDEDKKDEDNSQQNNQ